MDQHPSTTESKTLPLLWEQMASGSKPHQEKGTTLIINTFEPMTLKVERRAEMESTLEEAVRALSARAKILGYGVLVTRVSPNTFVATLSPDVPYGMTHEKIDW